MDTRGCERDRLVTVRIPALTATLRPVRSRTTGTASSNWRITRASGPRMASTMQNSDAPRRAVSSAAPARSSGSRKGVAFTGDSKRADWLQK